MQVISVLCYQLKILHIFSTSIRTNVDVIYASYFLYPDLHTYTHKIEHNIRFRGIVLSNAQTHNAIHTHEESLKFPINMQRHVATLVESIVECGIVVR